jgi:glycosyltransferase involved in cell wall biosynthesis
VKLSVVLITHNEERNLGRTLESVKPLVAGGQGEIIVVDSGSADRTVEIAESHGAKVFVEEWKGFAAQKNSALDKATGDWILSLDGDEEVSAELASEIALLFTTPPSSPVNEAALEHLRKMRYMFTPQTEREIRRLAKSKEISEEAFFAPLTGFWIPRKNHFLGRWIKHGGYWPDPKLRLFRRGSACFEDRLVHEDVKVEGVTGRLRGALLHHSYPTVSDYIEHMNRYSSLGAEMVVAKGPARFTAINLTLRPLLTFIYNYFFRLGFLDGKEGFLLHVNHSIYVAWKYAKAWELSSSKDQNSKDQKP